MLNMSMTESARTVLQDLLAAEKGPACFRLREFVSGCGAVCRGELRRVLTLTLDEVVDAGEDDLTVSVNGIVFVMDQMLCANYGNSFFICLDKKNIPIVNALRPLVREKL